jgi:hypothetical protein
MPSAGALRFSRRGGRIHITTVFALLSLALLALLVVSLPRLALAAKPKWATTAGAPFGPNVERPIHPVRSCDARAPVCVHAPSTIPVELVARARVAVADAWNMTVETMRIPRPLLDGARGGDPRLDVYLASSLPDGIAIGRDPIDRIVDRDAASGFVFLDEAIVRRGGCTLAFTAARAIVRASALGVDVAETENMVDGLARRFADVAAPCPTLVDPTIAAVQSKPWQSLGASPVGYQLLARTLDRQFGQGLGAIVPAVLSMATNHRGVIVPDADDELGPVHFHNATTVLDVLSLTLVDAGTTLEEVFLELASARALNPIPPAYEWVVRASSLPRRFAIRRAIEPMGMTFVKIDLDVPPKSDGIELDVAWDSGAKFVWKVLKVDAAGKKFGEVPVPPLETTRKITIDVRRLEGARSLVLCGVNVGDPIRPFHPDEPLSPGHAYELGIYAGT